MYNFSGLFYRIWGVCGSILFLGIACILLERIFTRNNKTQDYKLGLIMIAFAVCLGLVYGSKIFFPDVSSYTGEFIENHRNSRVAPPLPVTYEYIFWNSEGKRQIFYLDIFSKKEIIPNDFIKGHTYTIYFDEFTNVITKVDVLE